MRHLNTAQMVVLEQSIIGAQFLLKDTDMIGTFVGAGSTLINDACCSTVFQSRGPQPCSPSIYAGNGGSACMASGRLSFVLGFGGPCVSIDTACSSSLVAVHLAAASFHWMECLDAIAA